MLKQLRDLKLVPTDEQVREQVRFGVATLIAFTFAVIVFAPDFQSIL